MKKSEGFGFRWGSKRSDASYIHTKMPENFSSSSSSTKQKKYENYDENPLQGLKFILENCKEEKLRA